VSREGGERKSEGERRGGEGRKGRKCESKGDINPNEVFT
jgi:hypothetical protein